MNAKVEKDIISRDSETILSDDESNKPSINIEKEENHEFQDPKENLEMVLEKFTSYSFKEFRPETEITKERRFSKKIIRNPLIVFSDFKMVKKEIIFSRNGVPLFRLKPKNVKCQSFNSKSILSFYDRVEDQSFIIMEIEGEESAIGKFKSLLRKRNIHQSRNLSLAKKFESEARESPFTDKSKVLNLRGFLNLFILYSLLNYSRLIVQHTMNYREVFWSYWDVLFPDGTFPTCVVAILIYCVFFLVMFYVQKWGLKGKMNNSQTNYLSFILILVYFFSATYFIYKIKISVFMACFLNGCTVSVLFKCVSMAHVLSQVRDNLKYLLNQDIDKKGYHDLFRENEVSEENYLIMLKHLDQPEDILTIKKYVFYIMIPSFNFNLRYARKDKFDKIFFIKRALEFVILWSLMLFLIAHILLPILEESDKVFLQESSVTDKAIYIIRLAIPSTVTWVIMFLAVFHGYCQALAELCQLADRCFYLEWWNCLNLSEYWRTWNKPIHNFFVRHVAGPLKTIGLPRHGINLIIFMISAIFHEYVISLAVKRLCIYTLFSFTMQYFYMMWENFIMKKLKLEKSIIGNYIFWFLFCFYGQPTLVLTYYFWIKYNTEFVLAPI